MSAAKVSHVSPPLHPLDPLTADEISHAVAIVRKTRTLADDTLFVRVSLHEPPKDFVLLFRGSVQGISVLAR